MMQLHILVILWLPPDMAIANLPVFGNWYLALGGERWDLKVWLGLVRVMVAGGYIDFVQMDIVYMHLLLGIVVQQKYFVLPQTNNFNAIQLRKSYDYEDKNIN